MLSRIEMRAMAKQGRVGFGHQICHTMAPSAPSDLSRATPIIVSGGKV